MTVNSNSDKNNAQVSLLTTDGIINVKSFGAKGDGVTDDTAAIQNAINSATNGGTVFFPKGIYIVSIVTGQTGFRHAINIIQNLVMIGESSELSIIKLSNNAGNYYSILAGTTPSVDLSGFKMYDLTIDSNTTNNPIDSQINSYNRASLTAYKGNNIIVERCKFKDINSVQTVELGGAAKILSCRFEQSMSNNISHDHSTIYITSNDMQICNNVFYSPLVGLGGAGTAIELHGSNQVVTDNTIINYKYGANITGITDSNNSYNVVVANNNVEGCLCGFVLWSYYHGIDRSDVALKNVVVSSNNIRIDRDPWNKNEACGIMLDESSTSPMRGVIIADNVIFYKQTALGLSGDNSSAGIKLRTINQDILMEDILISNNIIENSICMGIRLATDLKKVQVIGNTIINCGQTKAANSVVNDLNKAGIVVIPNSITEDVTISNNTIVDNQAVATMKYVFCLNFFSGSGLNINSSFINNSIRTVDKSVKYYANYSTSWLFNMNLQVKPSSWFYGIQGSKIFDFSQGILYTQVVSPVGISWRAEAYGNGIPTSGTWIYGDKIYNTSPVSGSYIGWVCLASGTPGTWKGFGAIS